MFCLSVALYRDIFRAHISVRVGIEGGGYYRLQGDILRNRSNDLLNARMIEKLICWSKKNTGHNPPT